MKGLFMIPLALTVAVPRPTTPDCAGPERWPASMAFVLLKNAGLTNNDRTDFDSIEVTRLASERTSRRMHHQVHHIVLPQKDGTALEVITVNDASFEECSESPVTVFLVARSL